MIKGILLIIVFILGNSAQPQEENALSHCVEKYRHEWSKPCAQCTDSKKSYRVYFRNICDEKLDVKCAAQETDKRWRTFTRLAFVPGDSMVAYACNGNGKYLYWVRKAGDLALPLPTDEEINLLYGVK